MENKQTAMQELLIWVRKTLPMHLDYPQMIEAKIESLLPVEKKQIENSFERCLANIIASRLCEPEQYYNETYGKANIQPMAKAYSKRA